MADWVTHYLVARVPSIGADRRVQATFVVGSLVPDLLSKGLSIVMDSRDGFEAGSHAFIGFAIYAYLGSLLFERTFRPRAWIALTLGGWLHIFVDLWKDTLGYGAAFAFLPFSRRGVEFGVVDPGNIALILPAAVVLTLAWEYAAHRLRPDRYVWK